MSDPAMQTEEEEYSVVEEDEFEDEELEVPDEDIDEELLTGEEQEEEEEGSEQASEEEAGGAAAAAAAAATGQPRATSRGGNLGQLIQRANPLRLLAFLRQGSKSARKLVWQAEDLARAGAKRGIELAIKAAKPVVIVLVLSRVARTIDTSRDPIYRMSRLPPEQRVDYYYTQLLGKDWQQQLQQDLVEAIQEVDQGYNTEEINHEKRKLTATILRRLEVEEWDKERMRHFYYGQYGLGSWYLDMEERLHNPYFVGARAWNDPIESWVGENRVHKGDIPAGNTNFGERAVDIIEHEIGKKVDREALLARETLRPMDRVLGGRALQGVLGADQAEAKARVLEVQEKQ